MSILTGKTAIVGVGETPHSLNAGRTTLSMGVEAISKAVADAGLKLKDIDGMTSYGQEAGATADDMALSLGMRLNYSVDIQGGGTSTEALVAHAMGLLAAGYCNAMVIFRSMRGRSARRPGGQSAGGGPTPIAVAPGDGGHHLATNYAGITNASQSFAMSAMRYIHDYGLSSRHLGAVAVTHRYHASLNPKAFFQQPITIEDHQNSRWIVKPFHLLDCCLETDVACALVMVRREDAYDRRHPPVYVLGGTARVMGPNALWPYSNQVPHYHASNYGRQRAFGTSGVKPSDIDVASLYDAFTYTSMVQLEGYGFVGPGEAGPWYEEGRGRLDADLPINTSGGHLSEGYTNGIQFEVEMARQLRGRADDLCPEWEKGIHTYDRAAGCRQVRQHDVGFCGAWGTEARSSSLVLSRFPTA